MKIIVLFLIQAKLEFSKFSIFNSLLIAFVKKFRLNLKRNSKNFFPCPVGPGDELFLKELIAAWISLALTWVGGGVKGGEKVSQCDIVFVEHRKKRGAVNHVNIRFLHVH